MFLSLLRVRCSQVAGASHFVAADVSEYVDASTRGETTAHTSSQVGNSFVCRVLRMFIVIV